MDNKALTTLIVVAVLFLIVGGGVGMAYQTQKDSVKIKQVNIMEPAFKGLSSKVIPSIVAYGQVTNIEGRNITLSYSGESLTVKIKDNANIYSFATAPGTKTASQEKANFSDIKKGDNLNISLKLLADGSLEGQSAIILPLPTAAQ